MFGERRRRGLAAGAVLLCGPHTGRAHPSFVSQITDSDHQEKDRETIQGQQPSIIRGGNRKLLFGGALILLQFFFKFYVNFSPSY